MLTQQAVRNTIDDAIGFFSDSTEPHALLWLNVMYRRFGVEAFADAVARFDAEVEKRPDEAPVLRVLRRIADADNPVVEEDWEHVTKYTDRMLVAALYCDRVKLPASFPEVLDKTVRQGGYFLTHALLTHVWVRENRGELELPDGFVDDMHRRVAEIVNQDPATVDDLKLEAAAFLCLARQASRVDLRFVQSVVAIQNKDGGWGQPENVDPENPDGSSWHSTILALLLLLHVDFPAT